jgi:hypothetical protein
MSDPTPYDGPERRQHLAAQLTDEQVEAIAERAAKKAVELMTRDAYAAVGKNVVHKALWIIGVMAVAAFVWAAQHGLISPKP